MNYPILDKLQTQSRQSERKSNIFSIIALILLGCFGILIILTLANIISTNFIFIPIIILVCCFIFALLSNYYYKQAVRYYEAFLKKFYEEMEKDRYGN